MRRLGCILLPLAGMLMTGFMAYLLVVQPASRVFGARKWTSLRCRVVSSQVVQKSPTTYKAEVRYRYRYAEHEYVANRMDFIDDSGTRNPAHQRPVLDHYPVGREMTCYVNPAAPQEAVLDRGLPARMWWGVLPLVLLGASVIGLLVAVFTVE